MATPSSRETLKQYALRALGKPVIDINVDEEEYELEEPKVPVVNTPKDNPIEDAANNVLDIDLELI